MTNSKSQFQMNPVISSLSTGETVPQLGVCNKPKAILRRSTNWIGDRESAGGALERNLLANKIIRLFTRQTSSSHIRTVAHHLQITAILKLPKLALCPLSTITTQSLGGEGKGEGGSLR
jgi:hypothetical protein